MSEALLPEALERWQACLPADGFKSGPEALHLSTVSREGLRRSITAFLKPKTIEQVQEILRIAQDTKQTVYPISTGKNVGMGSHLPVANGSAVLDLSGLNRIREISEEGLYAVVEPGVTQGALYDEIEARKLPLVINVTGAARDTSLIGNSLDRGMGYFHERRDDLAGLEVVLANGEIFRSGFGAFPSATCASVYAPGLGPDLGALFSQSNFGVVTASGFKLMPRPEKQAALLLSSRPGVSLETFLSECIALRRLNIIQTIMHVANGERSRITLEPLLFDEWQLAEPNAEPKELLERLRVWFAKQPTAEWNAVCGLSGSRIGVKTAVREVKGRMGSLAIIRSFSPESLEKVESLLDRMKCIPPVARKLSFLRAVKPLLGLAWGCPSDAPQRALDWDNEEKMGSSGVLYTLPIYPAVTAQCLPALKRLEKLSAAHGFPLSITLNIIDTRVLEGVLSISFDRGSPDLCEKAQHCIHALEELSIQDGFPPYRTGIDRMDLAHPDDAVRSRVLAQLKSALDSDHILSPGRYVPDEI